MACLEPHKVMMLRGGDTIHGKAHHNEFRQGKRKEQRARINLFITSGLDINKCKSKKSRHLCHDSII